MPARMRWSPSRGSRALLAAALLAGSAACEYSSPTPPPPPSVLDLTGTWIGALPIRTPAGQDWSEARILLLQIQHNLTGEIVSQDGARHPVTGSVSGAKGSLSVQGLPGDSTCAGIQFEFDLQLRLRRADRLAGRAFGRCFGTIAGDFELRRAG